MINLPRKQVLRSHVYDTLTAMLVPGASGSHADPLFSNGNHLAKYHADISSKRDIMAGSFTFKPTG